MKTRDLLEQTQRRRSKEELAAEKAAPGYWRVEARNELNALVRKFGGTTREKAMLGHDPRIFLSERETSVLVSGDGSLTLHRDKRARGLLLAIGRFLLEQAQQGRNVIIGTWASAGSSKKAYSAEGNITDPPNMDDIMLRLNDAARLEETLHWLNGLGERGEKMPARFNLRFSIYDPSVR